MQVGIDNQSNFDKTFFYVSLVQDPLFLGVEVGGGGLHVCINTNVRKIEFYM